MIVKSIRMIIADSKSPASESGSPGPDEPFKLCESLSTVTSDSDPAVTPVGHGHHSAAHQVAGSGWRPPARVWPHSRTITVVLHVLHNSAYYYFYLTHALLCNRGATAVQQLHTSNATAVQLLYYTSFTSCQWQVTCGKPAPTLFRGGNSERL